MKRGYAFFVVETLALAQLLVSQGADPSITNAIGKTAATVTFEEEYYDIASFLRSITGETEPPLSNDEQDLSYLENNEEIEKGDEFDEVQEEFENDGSNYSFSDKFAEIMRASEKDGINRDGELRDMVTQILSKSDLLVD